jgi:hypothetical protein
VRECAAALAGEAVDAATAPLPDLVDLQRKGGGRVP